MVSVFPTNKCEAASQEMTLVSFFAGKQKHQFLRLAQNLNRRVGAHSTIPLGICRDGLWYYGGFEYVSDVSLVGFDFAVSHCAHPSITTQSFALGQ